MLSANFSFSAVAVLTPPGVHVLLAETSSGSRVPSRLTLKQQLRRRRLLQE
jgi:hypothetical protein